MALSNAERQRRYITRLKAQAQASNPTIDQLRELAGKSLIDWTDRKTCETPEELEEAIADSKPLLEVMAGRSYAEAHAQLIRDGMLIDIGERRSGRIVWTLSEKAGGLRH